jgi:hypothetical protein
MKIIIKLTVMLSLFLMSCTSEPSLQKYFVEKSENKNFISFDVSPSILNVDQTKLSEEQKAALKSFEKMNVLAFKLNDKNQTDFSTERQEVNLILKNEKYQQLMKFGSGKEGASISYVGEDNHINEFILYGNKKDAGFAVVRILGKDMNPNNIMTLISIMKDSKMNLDQLKPLQDLMLKK